MKRGALYTIVCVCLLSIAVLILEYYPGAKETEILTEDIVIENDGGLYTRAQIMIPANYQEKRLPLVSLSHGFRGSMDSAGGNYLAENLAKNGIATIRMDFARCRDAEGRIQMNQYTVNTMISDQIDCIDYMAAHYNIDTDRIGLYGRSLGGRVAMAMANEGYGGYDYQALALVAPAGNQDALQYYMGGQKNWNRMKSKAERDGSVIHQKVILTPDFFLSVEDYIPSQTAGKFRHPVFVIYNTEDYVVLPETSIECAENYKDVHITRITSVKSPHGCEMGFKSSKTKDQLIAEITAFFLKNL
ncbi:alpha/beta hydrolase family protein [Ihubacter sp. mB4P-1]|uniref:alpha/beta hydrolase family protein n=1 Tax=Ihubacter sp. mB4P-1 TaxID=3242370 RepID=UPI00137A3E0C